MQRAPRPPAAPPATGRTGFHARPDDLSGPEATLVGVLRWRATHQSEHPACAFIDVDANAIRTLSYARLDLRARAVAARLQATLATGNRVLLVYPQGLAFVEAFLGCLYAGMVAVPVEAPHPRRGFERLERLAAGADIAAMLTAADGVPCVRETRASVGSGALTGVPWVETDAIADDGARDWRDPRATAETLAWLQYTSGSTGGPKGVCVRHGDLVETSRTIRERFGHDAHSHMLSWLPHYHDMGLVGGILHPLHAGFPVTLMAPSAFAQRPLRWLQALTRTRATTSGAPNFAYELCARRVRPEALADLDLSSWTIAYNGAERVRAGTLERFAERFAPCGFRREALYPCYGMAEATLLITGSDRLRGPRVRDANAPGGEVPMVSCGRVTGRPRVAIVDPEARTQRPDGEVGEIWVSGPGIAAGYWRAPEASEATFRARLPDDPAAWLRTGDLGFLDGGELYVTGRAKDLLIVAGVNHHPEDVEDTVAECHPWLAPGRVAAFAVEDGEFEQVCVALELERHQLRAWRRQPPRAASAPPDAAAPGALAARLEGDVRAAVSRVHGIQVDLLLCLPPLTLPRTTSGKIRRAQCSRDVRTGSLQARTRARPAGAARPTPGAREDARWLDPNP